MPMTDREKALVEAATRVDDLGMRLWRLLQNRIRGEKQPRPQYGRLPAVKALREALAAYEEDA